MSSLTGLLSAALVLLAVLVFVAGTVALIRLPDPLSRLHAISKIDNLGFGVLVIGLMMVQITWIDMLKLLGIWLLVLYSSAATGQLIARHALSAGEQGADQGAHQGGQR
ncbi:cation:proton antiporter [Motiliproteus sp.]|uniref:cation:proton antiporter n=1 Tax=Motiliproteus sp. TaxID=1898955 RepID=UPI003BAD1466